MRAIRCVHTLLSGAGVALTWEQGDRAGRRRRSGRPQPAGRGVRARRSPRPRGGRRRAALRRFFTDRPALVVTEVSGRAGARRGGRACPDPRGERGPRLSCSAAFRRAGDVRALRAGADDYVTKPFGVGGAALRASTPLLRRARPSRARRTVLEVPDDGVVRIDFGRRSVDVGGTAVRLTPLSSACSSRCPPPGQRPQPRPAAASSSGTPTASARATRCAIRRVPAAQAGSAAPAARRSVPFAASATAGRPAPPRPAEARPRAAAHPLPAPAAAPPAPGAAARPADARRARRSRAPSRAAAAHRCASCASSSA